jgi:hypothetical protein
MVESTANQSCRRSGIDRRAPEDAPVHGVSLMFIAVQLAAEWPRAGTLKGARKGATDPPLSTNGQEGPLCPTHKLHPVGHGASQCPMSQWKSALRPRSLAKKGDHATVQIVAGVNDLHLPLMNEVLDDPAAGQDLGGIAARVLPNGIVDEIPGLTLL